MFVPFVGFRSLFRWSRRGHRKRSRGARPLHAFEFHAKIGIARNDGSPFFFTSPTRLSRGECNTENGRRRMDTLWRRKEGRCRYREKGEVPCSPWPVLGGRSTPRQKFFEQGTTCPRKTRPACIDSTGALPSSFVLLFVSDYYA